MSRLSLLALMGGLLVLTGEAVAQEKKEEPKKDDPPTKLKGFLPMNWGKLGLTEDQKQKIYKIQGKANDEIEKLEAKIRELKSARDKELKTVLSEEQKKRLEDILLGKDK